MPLKNAQEAKLIGPSRVHPSRISDIADALPFEFEPSKMQLLYDNTTKDAYLPKSKIKACKQKRRTVDSANNNTIKIAHNTLPAEIECQLITMYGKHSKPNALEFIHSTSVNKAFKHSRLSDIQKYLTVIKTSLKGIHFNFIYENHFKRHVDDVRIVQALHDENVQQIFKFRAQRGMEEWWSQEFVNMYSSLLRDLNAATKSNTFAFAQPRSPNAVDVPSEFVYEFANHLPPIHFFQQNFAYEQKNAQNQVIGTQPRYNITLILYTECFNRYFILKTEGTRERIAEMTAEMGNDEKVRNTMDRLLMITMNNRGTTFIINLLNLSFLSPDTYVTPLHMLREFVNSWYGENILVEITYESSKQRPFLILEYPS